MEVKKIVEGMTAPQVAQVIDDNFKNQNKILEEDIATQNSVIGVSEYKDFSEAEAVNVGDVRKYNGFLYECVEATTGAFDASKWKKSSFKAETEKKLSELGSKVGKGYNKAAQIPYSFEKMYGGMTTNIRSNNFNPCIVYGIIFYASKTGVVELYSQDLDNSSFVKIEDIEVKHTGFNAFRLSVPFEISEKRKLGYASEIIGTRQEDNVLGMYEVSKTGAFEGIRYYKNFEAVYGVVTSLHLMDILDSIAGKASKESTFIKTLNPFEAITRDTLGNTQYRANNFNGTAIGMRVYAESEGFMNYGLMKSDFSCEHIDKVFVNAGINDIYFKNKITCGAEQQIYINVIDAVIHLCNEPSGIGMWDAEERKIFANYEIAYWLIEDIGTDGLEEQIKNLDTKLSEFNSRLSLELEETKNPLESINQFKNGAFYKRANNFVGLAQGIRIYALGNGIVEYGILNISGKTTLKVGEIMLHEGTNDYLFEEPIQCDNNQKIYLYSGDANIIGATSSNGVGMYELVDSTGKFAYYNSWELAYELIKNYGVEGQFAEQNKRLENLENEIELRLQKTSNELDGINEYTSGGMFKRANNFNGIFEGIRIYALTDGIVEYGLLDVNSKTSETLGSIVVHEGINDYIFKEKIACTDDVKIYVYCGSAAIIGATSSNGVGMYELVDSTGKFTYYNSWELSYQLIENFGIKGELESLKKELDKDFVLPVTYGEIIIPSVIHIATGRECNLWWSSIANIEEGDKSVYFETVCDIGKNTERGFVIDSSDSVGGNIGNHALRIVSRKTSNREIISDVTTTLKIVNKANGSGSKNILMMGDSRTWQSFGGTNGTESFSNFVKGGNKTITSEVKDLLDKESGINPTFIGHKISSVNSSVRNCADSGQGYRYPLNQFNSAGSVESYAANNGLTQGVIDIATIMYGINDLSDWGQYNIGQFEISISKVNTILSNAKELVDAIVSAYPNCKIVMVIESTTCANQDGWAYWEGNQTKRHSMLEMEKAQKYLRKRIIKEFDNSKYSSNVILSSAGLWCDRLYGFPYIIGKVSSRCSAKTKEIFQECVHPFDDGYKQIADGIFSTIEGIV